MKRTDYDGELRLKDVGRAVALVGWVANRRDLGSIEFIDLRDNTGIVQLAIADAAKVPDVRSEYVIAVTGVVRKKETPNPKLPTGEVEVAVESLEIVSKSETPPFLIADKTDALEDTRLAYRYLDLRRPVMLERLRTRAQIVRLTHEYLDANRFLEVETPILNLATPEGARDYIVPSRLHHGSFYALPQSPQLFKQLLMIGGIERYYQIARCFRDEDLRADRQPEFTQIDCEMSFMGQEEILTLAEGMLARYFKEILNINLALPLRRLRYWEAMDKYGSDKPDTRYGLHLNDLADLLKGKVSYQGFAADSYIKGLVIPGYAPQATRKTLEEMELEAKKFNLRPLFSLKAANGVLEGSFAKYLSAETMRGLWSQLGLKDGDWLLFASSPSRRDIDFGLGALRSKASRMLNLIPPDTYDLLWVVDFPMFDRVEGENRYVAEHHPFTRPRDEDLPLLDTDPEKVLAYAYDIVINGYEAGGGTLRIYDRATQWKIFRLLGLSDEEVARRFGWFIDAFKYGTPPHGGFALGLDRLAMILAGTDNIRDVEAFPKNLQAVDPMSHAPAPVSAEALDAVGIALKKE